MKRLFIMLALLLPTSVYSGTLPVSPSGDVTGATDYVAIMDAFNAAQDGDTIQLAAGTFYIHKSIVVPEFTGVFRGSGKAITTIQTAPGIDFDLSEAIDWAGEVDPVYAASMFLFPYNPGGGQRSFTMSDISVLVTEPGVDPPQDGFVDTRRPYLLNTMHAVNVINTTFLTVECLEYFLCETVNLEVSIENLRIEGVQDSGFRGFWDEFWFDRDNSIFDGLLIWGFSTVPNASVVNVDVLNADIGMNPSDFYSGVSIEGGSIENHILGVESFFSRLTISNTMFDSTFSRYAIGLIYSSNSTIESNSITGSGFVPIVFVGGENGAIRDNTVTGSWIFGVNPYLTYGCSVMDNVLRDFTSVFGVISVEYSDGCTVQNNTFENVGSPYGAVWVLGESNIVRGNDYTQSGLPGWAEGAGAVLLDVESAENYVRETQFPPDTTMCDQVLDLSGTGKNAQGENAIPGFGVCNNNPEIAEHVQQALENPPPEKPFE